VAIAHIESMRQVLQEDGCLVGKIGQVDLRGVSLGRSVDSFTPNSPAD
jgi:hypothetical protein